MHMVYCSVEAKGLPARLTRTGTRWLVPTFYVMQGYAPVRLSYEDFYTRRLYYRIHVSVTQTLE